MTKAIVAVLRSFWCGATMLYSKQQQYIGKAPLGRLKLYNKLIQNQPVRVVAPLQDDPNTI